MYPKALIPLLSLFIMISCSAPEAITGMDRPLEGLRITIDPGHGATEAYDSFREGQAGEREEWINLRVAKALHKKLVWAGASVQLTRKKDRDVSLGGRASLAKQFDSDLLVSIHHNGSGNDPSMDLPIVYFHGEASTNPASVDLAEILIEVMREKLTFEQPQAGAVYSDHLIYSSGTSILRNTIDHMPGVIGEGGFFTNLAGEARLKSKDYNQLEAEVYFQAILKYVNRGLPSVRTLTPDTLKFLDDKAPLEFHLNDGFGSYFFEEKSFAVYQDGEPLPYVWDTMSGRLKVQPRPFEDRKVTFQVFGRNFKGNAIHPRPITFLTEQGYLWYEYEKWEDAYTRAGDYFAIVNVPADSMDTSILERIDEAIHLYQLSLELQIVHPQARTAEERILSLLELKQKVSGLDLNGEISEQTQRLKEYYPQN